MSMLALGVQNKDTQVTALVVLAWESLRKTLKHLLHPRETRKKSLKCLPWGSTTMMDECVLGTMEYSLSGKKEEKAMLKSSFTLGNHGIGDLLLVRHC